MKEVFAPVIDMVRTWESPIFESLAKRKSYIDDTGKRVNLPSVIGYNERGVGGRQEMAGLPYAGRNEYFNTYAWIKFFYAVLALSGPTLRLATQGHASSMIAELAKTIEGTLNAYNNDMRRQVWSATGDAVLFQVTSVRASETLLVDNTKFIRRGMYVEFFTATGTPPTQHLGTSSKKWFRIESVDHSANTMVLDETTNVVATDKAYREGNAWVSGSGLAHTELTSIPNIISSTGTLQGVNRSTAGNEHWRAHYDTGSSRTMGLIELTKVFQDMFTATGNVPDTMGTSCGVWRAFLKMLADKNAPIESMPTTTGSGSTLAFTFMGKKIPVQEDYGIGTGIFYGITSSAIWRAQGWPAGFDPIAHAGGQMQQLDTRVDAYGTLYTEALQIVVDDLQKLLVSDGWTEPTSSS
jgi:hypothetical protein